MHRLLLFVSLFVLGCESKPEPAQQEEDEMPPVPTITAAPGSQKSPPPPPPPPTGGEEQVDEEAPAEVPVEAAPKKSSRSGSGPAGGLGTSGVGSGGGGRGDGSMDDLLEAKAPSAWRPKVLSVDRGEVARAQQLLARRNVVWNRCAAFFDEDVAHVTIDVRYDGTVPRSVDTRPANETASECFRTHLGKLRLPEAPSKLSFELRR